MTDDYDVVDPTQRQIYKFIKTLFHSAQLTAECAIITLVSNVTEYAQPSWPFERHAPQSV